MGTRCDFYLGRGPAARYLGSIGHDAYVDAMAERFENVHSEAEFESRLQLVFSEYGEIPASKGWPWPWRDSATTDTVVAFDQGQCWTRHPDNVWALLSTFDEPTDQPCVFADMRSEQEATPEGRLRLRLRYGADLAVGPKEDVLQVVLFRAAALLTQATLHQFPREGAYWGMSALWERPAFELRSLASALSSAGDEFQQMLADRKAVHNEVEGDLLTWRLENGGHWPAEPADMKLHDHPEWPVYLGQPCGAQALKDHPGLQITYLRFDRTERIQQVLPLLDLCLNRAPSLLTFFVASFLQSHGCVPVPREKMDLWMDEVRLELGMRTLEECAKSPEGRVQVLKYAAALLWNEPCVGQEVAHG